MTSMIPRKDLCIFLFPFNVFFACGTWLARNIICFLRTLRGLCVGPADAKELMDIIFTLQDIVAVTGQWETEAQKRKRMEIDAD